MPPARHQVYHKDRTHRRLETERLIGEHAPKTPPNPEVIRMALSMAAGAIDTSEEQARRQGAVADARGLTRPSRGGYGPLRENRGFGQVGVKKLALWGHEDVSAHARAKSRLPKTLERSLRASLYVASLCGRRIPSGTGKTQPGREDPEKFRTPFANRGWFGKWPGRRPGSRLCPVGHVVCAAARGMRRPVRENWPLPGAMREFSRGPVAAGIFPVPSRRGSGSSR